MLPLAERMRPKHLDQFIGQEHLVGEQGVLRKILLSGVSPSIIFWGPPGVGKTTLASLIATYVHLPFVALSAVGAGVKEVREVIDKAKFDQKTILFIDEIHRFNTSQQDALLGAIEKGIITLIGATTENPSFEIVGALLSRCQVYVLKPLTDEHLKQVLQKALKNDVVLSEREIRVQEMDALLALSGGDARKMLNLLEIIVQHANPDTPIVLSNQLVTEIAQKRTIPYDKGGENHFDIVSAFIKSIRGSDPNAAVYWLARMIEGGEDVKFIARRMLILASEDIGNANPMALVMANSCFQAVEVVGYPECRIILAQTAIFLACSSKSNTSYVAINDALEMVQIHGALSVPLHLRNAPTSLMKALEFGKNYQYVHDASGNFVLQEYMPEILKNHVFYRPGNNPKETEIRQFLANKWKDKYDYS